MNKYRIKRLYIKNFKLVEEADIDFEEKDIIVLDGPNGYGKTTIFDALELLITGTVSRIKEDDGRRSYKDVLFCKDGNTTNEIILKVEFRNDEKKQVVIAKRLESQRDIPIDQRKPTNFNMFQTHILNNFDEAISEENKKSQSDIEEIFDITELNRLYKLYYYIQQEESTRYLKDSEKNRREEISHLFNTQEENGQMSEVIRLRRLLNKEKKARVDGLEKLEIEFEKVKKSNVVVQTVEYSPIIPNVILSNWDKENPLIENEEQRKNFVTELNNINEFIMQFDVFMKAKHNRKIDAVLGSEKIIRDAIILGGFLGEYKEIEKVYFNQEKIDRFSNATKNKENLLILNKKDFVDLGNILNKEIKTEELIEKANEILLLQQKTSGISDIVLELNDIRKTLLDKFEKFTRDKEDEEKDCPFCGYNWEDKKELYKNFETKRLKYLNMYDENAKKIEIEFRELLVIYNKEVIETINENYTDEKINKTFYEDLRKSSISESVVNKFISWCEKNEIPIQDYFNKTLNNVLDEIELKKRVHSISKFIIKLKEEIDWNFEEHDNIFEKLNWIYIDIFKEDDVLVKKVNKNAIDKKVKYINECFESKIFISKIEIEKKIEKERKKLEHIVNTLKKVNKLTEIYKESIENYELKIINDIEMLFYIYSGRILQYYQRGMGIFIQNTSGGLKFVSSLKTDHDATNYLSSGQLSALVMSFTFALNKIYSNNKLGILLIDDPVQTMDDINMSSLVELLRNELSGRQIIMSTHEDNVSRFLRYKFSKYGLKHHSFNVKESLL